MAALEAMEQCVASLDLSDARGLRLLDALSHSMRACHSGSGQLLLHLRIVALLAAVEPSTPGDALHPTQKR